MVTAGREVPGNPVRVVWRHMAPQRRELAAAGILGALASISAVALLGTSGWLISRAAEQPAVLTLGVAAVLVRTFALSRALFRYAERLVGHDAAFRGLTGLRVFVYGELERLAPNGLAAFGRGDALTRLVNDVDAALDLPVRVVLPWAQAVLVSAATLLFLGWLLPAAAALVAALALAALVAVPWLVARTARAAEHRMAPARAELSAAVVEVLDATPDLTAFGASGQAAAAIRRMDDGLTRLNAREAFALGTGGGIGILVQGAAVAGSLMVAVPAVTAGRLAPVWLAVAALLPLALFDVLATLPASALAYQRLRGSAARLVDVEQAPTPVPPRASPLAAPAAFAGMDLVDVSATWVPPDRPAQAAPTLRGITMHVDPGERVGVVGPSGAGKSTLAAVLMGFLPYSGSLLLSGSQVRDLDGDVLRESIGLLSQQAHLFDTTIADNVRLGDRSATADDIRDALRRARLIDWVDRLPEGVDTVVGSFGAAVSGGERQRIALARVLLGRRRLVILDEPTEHLDAPTADALAATFDTSLAGTSLVVITHRLADLRGVDRIVELQDGSIAAQGTHEELLAAGGWYARQWRVEAEQRDLAALLPRLPVGTAVALTGPTLGA
ncbi:MAG: thiol reductant ABC exporter subunit CydC [Candidatus Nanopelagicales bacterium]